MNCERVNQLLPLFVAGDLKAKQTEQVSSHLVECASCRLLADDFKQSQEWLHLSTSSQFDESFFDELRDSVHREIAQQTTQVSQPLNLLPSWSFRFGLAAMTIAIVFIGLNLYFKHKPQGAIDVIRQTEHQKADQATGTKQAIAIFDKYKSASPGRHKQAVSKSKSETKPLIQDFQAALEPREIPNASELSGTVNKVSSQTEVADTQEMLRIELQTSDPNIRIIWFTPIENNLATKADHQ